MELKLEIEIVLFFARNVLLNILFRENVLPPQKNKKLLSEQLLVPKAILYNCYQIEIN